MSKEKKLKPELRFPEFLNAGEWEVKKLQTLADRVVKKNKDGKIDKVFTNSAAHGIVDQREYFDKDIANKSNLENYYIVESGDYVYNPRISTEAPVGPTSRNNIGQTGVMSPLYTVFRFKDKENQFFEYYFNSWHWFDTIRKASNTGARFDRMSITDSVFMAIPILYPMPKEQQKIASCLSSLDELIAAHKDKLDVLKDHKKGLLQNLFPQEDETVPKVRFKEFEGDGEWNETTLVQVADYENGKAHEKDIDEDGNFIVVNSKFISTEGETVKYSNTAFCPASEADILMVLSDIPNGKAIAKCFYVDEDDKYSVNQRICRITATGYDSRFLFYIMDRNAYFLSFDDGVKQTNLRKSDVLEFPFRIPTDPIEQTKIASCISAVDELIKAQTKKIEELNQHKRGLMQGLFPKIES
jgi:type I restriction enzyme S subunit